MTRVRLNRNVKTHHRLEVNRTEYCITVDHPIGLGSAIFITVLKQDSNLWRETMDDEMKRTEKHRGSNTKPWDARNILPIQRSAIYGT
jgi:hypothetical protein